MEYDGMDHMQVCPIYLSFLFTPSLHLVTKFILPFAPLYVWYTICAWNNLVGSLRCFPYLQPSLWCSALAFPFCKRFRLKSIQNGPGLVTAITAVPPTFHGLATGRRAFWFEAHQDYVCPGYVQSTSVKSFNIVSKKEHLIVKTDT